MDFTDYPRPSLAVDPAVLSIIDGELRTALWRRTWEPFAGAWALPGVFVGEGESLEQAASRGILEKVGISASYLEQLFTWNVPDRDERGWVVTVAYFAIVAPDDFSGLLSGQSSAFKIEPNGRDPETLGIDVVNSTGSVVSLAFDHTDILISVVDRLRDNVWRSDIALRFLPERFTLRALQSVYEAILGRPLNKDSFRRRVVQTQELVVQTGTLEDNVSHRPAELYARSPNYGTSGA